MVAKIEAEALPADSSASDLGVYLDASALAKLYLPEPESDALDARHANQIRDAVLADAGSGSFRRLDLTPAVHRNAE